MPFSVRFLLQFVGEDCYHHLYCPKKHNLFFLHTPMLQQPKPDTVFKEEWYNPDLPARGSAETARQILRYFKLLSFLPPTFEDVTFLEPVIPSYVPQTKVSRLLKGIRYVLPGQTQLGFLVALPREEYGTQLLTSEISEATARTVIESFSSDTDNHIVAHLGNVTFDRFKGLTLSKEAGRLATYYFITPPGALGMAKVFARFLAAVGKAHFAESPEELVTILKRNLPGRES